MDPVSAGASIIAFIQLADRVVEVCSYIIGAVKNYPKDIRLILVQTSSLKSLIESVDLLRQNDPAYLDSLISKMPGTLEECKKTIEELSKLLPKVPETIETIKPESSSSKLLDPKSSIRHKISRWPFSKSNSQEHFSEVSTKETAVVTTKGLASISLEPSLFSLEALKWPMREQKAQKLLQQLHQHSSTITLALTADSSRDIKAVRAAVQDEKNDKIHKWLITTNPSELHVKACMLHQEGTGSWILDTSEWQDWKNGNNRLLWIHGIPGAGKTVLASYLYKQIPEETSIFYYCYFGHEQDETRAFLGWIISQICQKFHRIPHVLDTMYNRYKYLQVENIALLDILEDLLKWVKKVRIVLDAVDESLLPRDRFLNIIRILATDPRFQQIQILATSREYHDIEIVLKPISSHIRMKSDSDIALYVDNELRTNRWFQKWPTSLRDDVTVILASKADGMFRWAVCQLDIFRRLKSIEAVKEAMNRLPKDLNETYRRIFSLISEEDQVLVGRTLGLIIGSTAMHQVMPLEQLVYLLSKTGEQNPSRLEIEFCDQDTIAECCGCLITFEAIKGPILSPKTGVVCCSLAHFTVQEFLIANTVQNDDGSNIHHLTTDLAQAKQIYVEAVLNGIVHFKSNKCVNFDEKLYHGLMARYVTISEEISHDSFISMASSANAKSKLWFETSNQIKQALLAIMNPSNELCDPAYLFRNFEKSLFFYDQATEDGAESKNYVKAILFSELLAWDLPSWACEILEEGNITTILWKTKISLRICEEMNEDCMILKCVTGTVAELYRTGYASHRLLKNWPTLEDLLSEQGIDISDIIPSSNLRDTIIGN